MYTQSQCYWKFAWYYSYFHTGLKQKWLYLSVSLHDWLKEQVLTKCPKPTLVNELNDFTSEGTSFFFFAVFSFRVLFCFVPPVFATTTFRVLAPVRSITLKKRKEKKKKKRLHWKYWNKAGGNVVRKKDWMIAFHFWETCCFSIYHTLFVRTDGLTRRWLAKYYSPPSSQRKTKWLLSVYCHK